MADPKTIPAYDPEREQVVNVPEADAKMLADAGYKVGPEAELESRIQGWEGKLAALGTGALRGLTLGASDLLMPKDLQQTQAQVEAAHPAANFAGGVVGGAPYMMAFGPAGRVGTQAVEGGIEAAAQAERRKQPIYAETVLQGMGLGALWGLGGEALGGALQYGLKGANKALAAAGEQVVPKDAAGVYQHPLGTDTEVVGTLLGGWKGFAAVRAANRVAPKFMNAQPNITQALDKLSEGPLKAVGDSVRSLFDANVKESVSDVDLEKYDERAEHIQKLAASPDALTQYMTDTYGPVFDAHPELWGQMQLQAHTGVQALAQALPTNPYPPTAVPMKYNPPLSVKMRWSHLFEASQDVSSVVNNPTPETVALADYLYPETMKIVRDMASSELAKTEASDITPRQARKLSTLLGYPVTPETIPEVRARMIAATQEQPQQPKPPRKSGGGGGGKAVTRDATHSDLRELEAE